MKRFLIVGLPRSGTTFLFTLLDAHPQVVCHGERFNVFKILENSGQKSSLEELMQRDHNPEAFFDAGFEAAAAEGVRAVGYKFMLGHNPRLMRDAIPARPDVALIYVHRENKLAQVASLETAEQTRRWAQAAGAKQKEEAPPLDLGPLKLMQRINDLDYRDILFNHWFDGLPNPKFRVEYRDLMEPATQAQIFRFLGVEPMEGLRSPLVKQGSNVIIDRFQKKPLIERYFKGIGREDWLGAEL